MRLVLSILLACSLFVITGCGSGSSGEKSKKGAAPSTAPQSAPAPAPAKAD